MYEAVVFFDLDGTLFDDDKHVPAQSIAAIKEMSANNILSVISTGRNVFEVQNVLDETNITSIVSANGSYVQYEGKKLHQEVIDTDLIQAFTAFANQLNNPVAYYNNRAFRLTEENVDTIENYKLLHLEPHVDPTFYQKEPINFMNVFNRDQEDLFSKKFNGELSLVRNNPRCLDTMKAGVSKRTGIEILLSAAHLEGIHTFAFGDQLNDLQMFDMVDTPVAMGNGVPEAKQKAAFVTTTNMDNGIVNGLRHFDLIK